MIVTKTITFTIDIDMDEIAPRGIYAWIFQFLNRLNYEHPIKSITLDGNTVDTTKTPLKDLPIGDNKPLK